MLKKVIIFQIGILFLLTLINCGEESAEHIYKDPHGVFQCTLPQSWGTIAADTFTPFSRYEDISQTMLQIITKPINKIVLSKDDKVRVLKGMEETKERVLVQRIRIIDGIEAWEILGENRLYRGQLRKRHQIWLINNRVLITFSLTASPELYESAERAFENIIKSLKFF